ncbi:MAG: carbamoyltransferase HypF [Nitrososphaerota archaeon]|nr:carbamoyltransferase HypF [Nitrososphaerota archaeon]
MKRRYSSEDIVGLLVKVKGVVQGVGFRPFVYRLARRYDLRGYVRNLGGGDVEIYVEGVKPSIYGFLDSFAREKPPIAIIDHIETSEVEPRGEEVFRIERSGEDRVDGGSIIPPDIAICSSCLRELRTSSDRRYRYFFITCTDCGPRFTVIEKLPYDRCNTSMKIFEMCDECRIEYTDPLDRRFHAQTIACPRCGPKVYLTDGHGFKVECVDPILEAGRLIDEGFIVAVKGYGGFHIATATTIDEPVRRLRGRKGRKGKPFAVMARDIEAVESFAEITDTERDILESYIRPIVLLRKSRDYYLSDLIAPNLHLVGVMLPYTGLHILLFEGTKEPALVMTSGNLSGQPIILDDREAISKLGRIADYILFHDRPIVQRCDDSVVKIVDRMPVIVRRSRGYTPTPIKLKYRTDLDILALGCEENVVACIVKDREAYLTQHIGDIDSVESLSFLKGSIEHFKNLLSINPKLVVCDLNPRFATTRLAFDLAEEMRIPLIQVQHHVAHVYSLLAETGLDEAVVVAADGFGYGLDGAAWGGEVIYASRDRWMRIGHLEEHPMVGGDLATRYPVRMVIGILRDDPRIEEWVKARSYMLPYGERELGIILSQLERGRYIPTTSCGRILDAVSTLLEVCFERTYEGEPAMKLESAAQGGEDVLRLDPVYANGSIATKPLIESIFDNLGRACRRDLAYSAHVYIARSFAYYAVGKASELGVKHIGFTGGVAYNDIIIREFRRIVEGEGVDFVRHRLAPPGDGGISLGQAYYALLRSKIADQLVASR